MDKIDRLLDAMEHPDCYSDQELESLLTDSEVMEAYDILDKTKASLTDIPTPDVDAEWKVFRRSHKKSFGFVNLFTRNIAASIAIAIASLAAVAAVVGVSVNYALTQKTEATTPEAVAEAKENSVTNDTIIVVSEEADVVAPETIVFDNEPLETIVTRIAEYYGYKADFAADAPKSLRLYFRWNQTQTLEDVVESLNNFEQIHIAVNYNTIKID